MEENGIRINKFLSEAGVCSRREADRQIEAGNVTIDGVTAQTGSKVLPGQEVCFQGKKVSKEEEMILIAFHKPVGIVCTAEKREKNNVIDYIGYPKRIYPVGRLDKDSEGLLLLTNNGDIVNKIMRSGNMHEKEYLVTVNKPVTDSFLHGMANGVPIAELSTMTRPCFVERTGKRQFKIILTQGLNRQIRRMCEYFGYRVEKLVRTRIMNIKLEDLAVGTYRDVTTEEYKTMMAMAKYSSNDTVIPDASNAKAHVSGLNNTKKNAKSEDAGKKEYNRGMKKDGRGDYENKSKNQKKSEADVRGRHDTGRKNFRTEKNTRISH